MMVLLLKYWKIALGLIVVGLLWVGVQEYKNKAVQATIDSIKLETLQQNEVVRKRVKDAVKKNKDSNPTADPNIALDRLRNRQAKSP